MSIITFQSTFEHDGVSTPITLYVHHRYYKKRTHRHLNQDPEFGSVKISVIHHGGLEIAFSSLSIEEQIRLRHESWKYILNHRT
ncbi:hypothetical protein ACD661_15525 [Legionella lytica]|uniref:Uncharacterized protein n=1 Tax=Legionella lytica TaxID=96232 RepID=A0ABW8DB89_9GAMM